jgi:TonB family protein
MSYKSLLFCPDEKTARLVTQVLSELEFTVKLSNEPFATVKTLTDEHFDALVVDCENEQDASLLFKAARNSSLNHSSLSVAVVEGQAGVAKAFRIGANLVLTKPINIEQSKGTLRVARGLLRKSEAKAASAAAGSNSTPAVSPATTPAITFAQNPAPFSAVSPAPLQPVSPPAAASAAPFSALELEQEPTPAPEPSEVAVLESLSIDGKHAPSSEPMWAPRSQAAEPIAASTGGQGAAAAPALAKTQELKLSGASPMVTQEPITTETDAVEHFPVTSVPVPTFSGLEAAHSSSGGGKKFIKTAALLLILGGGGYVAWQKLQPMQHLHGSTPGQAVKQPVAPAEPATPVSVPPSAAPAENNTVTTTPSAALPDLGVVSSTVPSSSSGHNFNPETIRVQELPMNLEQKNSLASKSQPTAIQVKPGSAAMTKPAQQQITPPALQLTGASNSSAALNSIVATDAPAPKPAPGSLRVSQGVSQGLVVKKVAPVYSATALQLRKEGPVELMATINKDGSVTGVRVLSGDLMLARSAVEAVKQWKYRPYLLNSEPVEIETQITVNFRLPR